MFIIKIIATSVRLQRHHTSVQLLRKLNIHSAFWPSVKQTWCLFTCKIGLPATRPWIQISLNLVLTFLALLDRIFTKGLFSHRVLALYIRITFRFLKHMAWCLCPRSIKINFDVTCGRGQRCKLLELSSGGNQLNFEKAESQIWPPSSRRSK